MKLLRNVLLCLAVLQLCPASIQSSGGPVASCCLKTSRPTLPRGRIKDYYSQKTGICPVDAVVFITIKRKRICADPTNRWVKRTMKYVNRKKSRRLAAAVPSPHLSSETAATRWNTTNRTKTASTTSTTSTTNTTSHTF